MANFKKISKKLGVEKEDLKEFIKNKKEGKKYEKKRFIGEIIKENKEEEKRIKQGIIALIIFVICFFISISAIVKEIKSNSEKRIYIERYIIEQKQGIEEYHSARPNMERAKEEIKKRYIEMIKKENEEVKEEIGKYNKEEIKVLEKPSIKVEEGYWNEKEYIKKIEVEDKNKEDKKIEEIKNSYENILIGNAGKILILLGLVGTLFAYKMTHRGSVFIIGSVISLTIGGTVGIVYCFIY